MTDDTAPIDAMSEPALRAYAAHLLNTVDRLLREREGHLRSVEAAFRRRHNDQQARIRHLEAQVARRRTTQGVAS